MVTGDQQRRNCRAFWIGTEYGGRAYWTSITEVGEEKLMNLSKIGFARSPIPVLVVFSKSVCVGCSGDGLHLVV